MVSHSGKPPSPGKMGSGNGEELLKPDGTNGRVQSPLSLSTKDQGERGTSSIRQRDHGLNRQGGTKSASLMVAARELLGWAEAKFINRMRNGGNICTYKKILKAQTDALAQPREDLLYAFLPFQLILRVLPKLQTSQAKVILIVLL